MATKYYALLTNVGAAKLANATALGEQVEITQMAVGDGNGALPTPNPAQTALVHELRRAPLNTLTIDPVNTNQIIAEQVIPEDVGGWWIREIGLYDSKGDLIAIANCAETYKPLLQEGSGRMQVIRVILIVSSTQAVTLKIDPSVVLATRQYVDDQIIQVKAFVDQQLAAHIAAADPHKQYAPKASPALTGTPTAPTAAQTVNNTQIATTEFVKSAIAALVASSPAALDTLNELAAALGDDPNFATTVTNALAGKQPLDSTLTDLSGKTVNGILQYLNLEETVKKAAGAIQKSGGNMEGPLGLTRTSSFGVATENTLGGNSIAIGDSDSGFKSNGDGNIALMANSVLAGYFSENELQHHEKVLTKIFRAISTGNATEGAGGFGSQLTSGAPFYSPAIVRQNNDNNYFPLWKQIVSLQSGYPVAASMGLLTTGEPNFPQIVLHAKTDFEVNDKLWVFDVATGELRSPALIKAGEAVLNTNGDISGSAWGGALTNWLNSQLATRDANINARATVDWVNSQLATRDANINARATVDWVNSNFNKKNTATLGFSGWSRDESTGLIMQWGNVDNARGTYSFPRAFNDTCFAVFATNKDGQGGAIDNAYGYPVSKTQFYLASKANSGADTAYGISWFALGY
ncbi:phage tail protein [Enterobacter hormaechei]|uniref:phage tail protein n=2 Tax=Enterobacter hormaechei TaxID=158836 RepID=UPI0015FAD607|nr:phage tail protein [Enterobacter hormaechei]MBA7908797.1 phage tail protein [Enterobacter hormaechei]